MCIDGIESMDVAHIADTLNVFFRRYFCLIYSTVVVLLLHRCDLIKIPFSFSGDFNIPINYMTSTEASVFWFTKEAVYHLMNKRRPIPPLRLYPAMLWSKFT